MAQEGAPGFFIIDHRRQFQIGFLEGQVRDFRDFVGAVKDDGAHALLLQLLQGVLESGLGDFIEFEGVLDVGAGQAGFFQHALGSEQVPYPLLGIGAEFKVAFLHQLLEVEVDQAQGDVQPFGQLPLGGRVFLVHFLQQGEGADVAQIHWIIDGIPLEW